MFSACAVNLPPAICGQSIIDIIAHARAFTLAGVPRKLSYRQSVILDAVSHPTLRALIHDVANEHPGPGSYNVGKGLNTDSVSFSTKGTGGFPSGTYFIWPFEGRAKYCSAQALGFSALSRLLRTAVLSSAPNRPDKVSRTARIRAGRAPAPNSYNIPSSLFSKKDFNNSNSSMFHQPIAIKVEETKHATPAPNQYEVSINFCHPNNNVSAHAAFVSGTKRDALQLNTLKGPSPCHYTINDSLVKESPKVLVSCFKSNTSRDVLNKSSNVPGPTSYDPYGSPEIRMKTVFP
ncbi:unnamed protein product [Ranitomeya imitator]|uniref:Uncharacterized protein n=1 Tax=Ranitomeya imitator TaxID=111125 RepID=A0ABN9MK56_9NEOB|nr:unnamed protein product [Ranitomeya imitator]